MIFTRFAQGLRPTAPELSLAKVHLDRVLYRTFAKVHLGGVLYRTLAKEYYSEVL